MEDQSDQQPDDEPDPAQPESPAEGEREPDPATDTRTTTATAEPAPPVELMPRENTPVGSALTDLPVVPAMNETRALAQLANTLAAAHVVPKDLRGKPNDVFAVLLSARDLGVALTTALREFHVIEGRVTLSPKVKLAMVRQSGLGKIYPHAAPRLRGQNDQGEPIWELCPCGSDNPGNDALGATWHAERYDQPGLVSSTFTWGDAQTAHLVDVRCTPDNHWKKDSGGGRNSADCLCKSNWKTYPGRMLSWRSAGYLTDDVFGEVGTGLYSPDELGAITDADGEPIEVRAVESLPGMKGGAQQPGAAGGDQGPDPISEDTVAELRPRVEAVKAHPEGNPDLKAWWTDRELPGLGGFTAAQGRMLTAKLAQLEAKFKIKPPTAPPESPADLEAEGGAAAPADPEPPQTPPEGPAEAQRGADGPETGTGDALAEVYPGAVAGSLDSAPAPRASKDPADWPASSPPDGDVFAWLIDRGGKMNGPSIKTSFTVAGLEPPQTTDLGELRRAWAMLTATQIMRGLLYVLSGCGLDAALISAIAE